MGIDSLKIEGRLKTEYYLASVVNAYRNAIDDYMKEPEKYDYTKYLKELEKTKTRGLTTFYFNDRNNKDFQEYDGKQYNPDYEFGGKVLGLDKENTSKSEENIEDKEENARYIIEIRNKLKVGDTMEILIPSQITPVEFKIEKLWDTETDEEVDAVNPGKAGQSIKMKLPIKCEKGWILRRKK